MPTPRRSTYSPPTGDTHVTVHPMVLYYKCPNCDDIITDYWCWCSFQMNKRMPLLQRLSWTKSVQHLQVKVAGLSEFVAFSERCAAQCKSQLSSTSLPVGWVCQSFGQHNFFVFQPIQFKIGTQDGSTS